MRTGKLHSGRCSALPLFAVDAEVVECGHLGKHPIKFLPGDEILNKYVETELREMMAYTRRERIACAGDTNNVM